MLLAHDYAVALQQPRAALDSLDLDAFDVELDQIFAAGFDLAVIDEVVEPDDRHFLAACRRSAGDAEGFVLGAGQPRSATGCADRTFHRLEAIAVDLSVVGELRIVLP